MYLPRATSAYSLVTAFAVTIVSPLGAKPQPPGPNARFSILLYLISGRYMMPSGLTSISAGSMGASSALAASGENASLERPWKDRVQSTCLSPSSALILWSLNPEVKSGTSTGMVSGDRGGWRSREVVFEAGDEAACACCAR